MATVKVDGLKDLEEALKQLERPAARKASARRSMLKASQALIETAKRIVPVDTLALQRSITASTKLAKSQNKLHKRAFRNDKYGVELFVGPSYGLGKGGRHGHLVEFGARGLPPKPFMRPAWNIHRNSIIAEIGKEMWVDIQKSAARAERKAARLAAKNRQ